MTLTVSPAAGRGGSAPARPDGTRIFELIKDRDPGWGAVTRFAAKVGCAPQTLWNIKAGYGASLDLLFRISAALGVGLTEIVRAGETPAGPLGEVA